MVQWVKDPTSSLQWLGSLLWQGFSPWPRNFYMPQMQPKKKKSKVPGPGWEKHGAQGHSISTLGDVEMWGGYLGMSSLLE